MLDYVAQVSEEARRELINPDIFDRTFDLPLHKQIVEIVRNLNLIPGLKLKSWELIPFAENVKVNKRYVKDKKIKNNPKLETLNDIRESWVDLLKFTFIKDANGIKTEIVKEMFCFRQDENHFYHINGKKVLPLNQIVDSSTFTKDTVLNFRTATFSYPIKIDHDVRAERTTCGKIIKARRFTIDIFNKKSNILVYHLAKLGLEETLKFFKMDKIIVVTAEEVASSMYYYVKLAPDIYVGVLKELYSKHQFITDFYLTLIDSIRPIDETKKTRKTIVFKEMNFVFSDLYDQRFWLENFSEMYSKKRNIKISRNGLISFERLVDPLSIKKIKSIEREHMKNTYTLIRYLFTEYDELMEKDNFDLENKRLRNNEVIASFFDGYLRNNINSLLNATDITPERIDKLLNTINHNSMFKATFRGSDSYDLFRYERYNDNSIIELSRFTMKGPGAISGGKYKTAMKYRDIYPSYLGRLDVTICSSSDPGLTGYLSQNVKVYDGGRFSKKRDPNTFKGIIDTIRLRIPESELKDVIGSIYRFKFINKAGKRFYKLKNEKPPIELGIRKPYMVVTDPKTGMRTIKASPITDGKGNRIYLPKGKMLWRMNQGKDTGYYYDKEGLKHFNATPKLDQRLAHIEELIRERDGLNSSLISSKKKK